jgi:hypothetical protein
MSSWTYHWEACHKLQSWTRAEVDLTEKLARPVRHNRVRIKEKITKIAKTNYCNALSSAADETRRIA